ncbi:TetR/AcrR family transcriptional regulator [Nocardioides sambongensis]|uniref:TetR/AcrR family transcriptional regulator n=1 Tax=Nocardioides sambongensis TaxID=2589074 RepID=UPI0011273ED6|nr:TetR/AcrR family transcriptional regulator [Nocardioides sambongensis]
MEELRADGRRNRSAILDAAAGTLAETGDLAFTAIAQRAGLTRATVYRHFPDRRALLAALAQKLADDLLTPLLAEIADLPLTAAWEHLARTAVSAGAEHAPLVNALDSSVEETARLAITDEPISSFLRHRREIGDLTSPLPDRWLARCVRSLCLTAVSDPSSADERVALLTRTLTALTQPEQAPAQP